MSSRPVALLTMSTGYVGPALAELLASQGYDLVLHGFEDGPAVEVPLSEVAGRASDAGAGVITVSGVDLMTKEGNETLVAAALEQFGRIDSACFVTGSIVVGPFLGSSVEVWEKVKRANLDMVFHALQAVLPPMQAAKSGQVVVFTSATGARPEPGVSLYGSTRAGANALVRAVGLEHASEGIQVNAVGTNYMDFPGFIAASGADDPERRAKIEKQVPARRLGSMEELAEFTSVLLNGKSRFQTGQFFSFSGGWSQ